MQYHLVSILFSTKTRKLIVNKTGLHPVSRPVKQVSSLRGLGGECKVPLVPRIKSGTSKDILLWVPSGVWTDVCGPPRRCAIHWLGGPKLLASLLIIVINGVPTIYLWKKNAEKRLGTIIKISGLSGSTRLLGSYTPVSVPPH